MAETEENPPETEPPPPAPRSDDVARLERWERWSSRVLFVGGLMALAVGALVTPDHRLPPSLLLAWIATFMAAKVGLVLLGLRAGWKAWPALLLEMLAFGVVGYIVRAQLTIAADDRLGILLVLVAAALLGAAGLVRRKAAA